MLFSLDIETHPAERRAVLRLTEHEGAFVGAHEVDLAEHAAVDWYGVFNTRRHVRSLIGKPGQRESMPAGIRHGSGCSGAGRAADGDGGAGGRWGRQR
jgi:hypothetical protein